ncbi:MAG TPA: phosphate ABC transporter substrate-binding protein PstS [Deltaproteobacteria bacterium]|nr:phosphate ABC transporter substrate-binding protein PstS [Deltaproteobacteria bacterium]
MKVMLAAALLLTLTAPAGRAAAAETLNGAGATFPFPLYSAWGYEYSKAAGVRLNYQSIGSGGGQRQISNRTVDFGASDAPLTPDKLDKERLLQFPAVIGGVVPVVNVRGIKPGALRLDAAVLCGIFMGEITRWDDKAIKALNPGLRLPGGKITVVHRSDGSGTTAIFTTYLARTCPAWKEKVGAGKAVKWPAGIGGKGNEGVANYVRRVRSSIGYVEYAYAKQSRLAHTKLKNRAGNFVEPSLESFQDAAASGEFDPSRHFHLWLVDAPGGKAWPIAGATFILLAREKKEVNRKVAAFFDWAFKNGDATAQRLAYVPLPPQLKDKIRAYWKAAGIY